MSSRLKKRQNRHEYRQDDWPAFAAMHVIFFLVQLFFFWIYFAPTPFTEWNIPVIYYRIQQIGYPTVLLCSLVLMNSRFFPGQISHLLISIVIFFVEWFGIDRLFIRSDIWEAAGRSLR